MSDFPQQLAAANARIQYGNDERTAGADDKARAIADEAARRGRGGARELARELGVSEKTISQAITRARSAPTPGHTLPADTLERLLAAERPTVPPLPALQWQALAHLVCGTVIDVSWIEQPGQFLAYEVEDAELGEEFEPGALAETCRRFSRAQALAVIDACQRDDLAALPVKE
jgi:DNA-binding transcriptional regulator YdaS (Cro superfamily)